MDKNDTVTRSNSLERQERRNRGQRSDMDDFVRNNSTSNLTAKRKSISVARLPGSRSQTSTHRTNSNASELTDKAEVNDNKQNGELEPPTKQRTDNVIETGEQFELSDDKASDHHCSSPFMKSTRATLSKGRGDKQRTESKTIERKSSTSRKGEIDDDVGAVNPGETQQIVNDQVDNIAVHPSAETCNLCKNVFTDKDDEMMICERCDQYFCTACIHMSSAEYYVLSNRSDSHWFCEACDSNAIADVLTGKEIEEKCKRYLQVMTARVDELEVQLQTKADISDVCRLADSTEKMMSDIDELKADVQSLKHKEASCRTEDEISRDIDISVGEMIEREKRKNNLVLFNVPEPEEGDDARNKAADVATVQKLWRDELNLDVIPKAPTRLGSKQSTPRPLRVEVTSDPSRLSVLRKAKTLVQSKNEIAKKIFIKRDITPMQRAEEKRLLKLRDEKREEAKKKGDMSANWVIRRRRVVNLRKGQQAE